MSVVIDVPLALTGIGVPVRDAVGASCCRCCACRDSDGCESGNGWICVSEGEFDCECDRKARLLAFIGDDIVERRDLRR